MDSHEAQIVIIQGFRRLLAPLGYSRRKLSWYRHGARCQTVCDVWLTERRWLVSVQLARFDGAARKLSHPDRHDASDAVGMSALVPSWPQWRQARDYSRWSAAADAAPFFELVEQYGLPQLRHWTDA